LRSAALYKIIFFSPSKCLYGDDEKIVRVTLNSVIYKNIARPATGQTENRRTHIRQANGLHL